VKDDLRARQVGVVWIDEHGAWCDEHRGGTLREQNSCGSVLHRRLIVLRRYLHQHRLLGARRSRMHASAQHELDLDSARARKLVEFFTGCAELHVPQSLLVGERISHSAAQLQLVVCERGLDYARAGVR
jgi:hypothetical protein